jgi:hypothetical protein
MKRLFTKTILTSLGQRLKPAVAMVLLGLWVGTAATVHAGRNPNPGVLPANSTPYGKTYGNWGAAWWTWALAIPAAQNPILDATGEFCHIGQEGPVWFLAGTFGGPATRSCTVPRGKALLVAILNQVLNAPEDVPYSQSIATHLGVDPSTLTAEEVMRLAVNWNLDHASVLAVTVDGVDIKNVAQYRDDSDPFALVLSDIFEPAYPAGPRELNVADGYYVMLRPLTPGTHTIHVQSGLEFSIADGDPFDFEFSMDVTYHLTVE